MDGWVSIFCGVGGLGEGSEIESVADIGEGRGSTTDSMRGIGERREVDCAS